MKPIEQYQQAISSGNFIPDSQQQRAVEHLQRVYDDILNAQKKSWKKIFSKQKTPIKGLYLWGEVGAGKTWLMDIFYDALPISRKLRMHFHRFIHRVHDDLKKLQGKQDPLKIVAKKIAAEADVLCFDEFIVADITDAMLLANLLDALFAQGVTLVTTSNTLPDNLYRNGLQRGRFLPAIELIKQHTEILHLQSQQDYRLRVLTQLGIYFSPLNETTVNTMQRIFAQLTHERFTREESLVINDRTIETKACGNQIVWFDFNILCHVPRSQLDYLEISRCFHTVLLSNVPKIAPEEDNLIVYLINLVDVFYDAKVKLIISAAVSIGELYTQGRYVFQFQRTKSRLLEMQSLEYFHAEHIELAQENISKDVILKIIE